jgi:hypothetical protein
MQGGGTGNATGGHGGAISLSATGAIDLPNTFLASPGGFAAGLGRGGTAGPITVRSGSGDVSLSDVFANGGGSFFGNDGSGGALSIRSGGAVSLSGEIDTRYFGVAGIPSHAGAVTINALGNVALGTGISGINLPAISSFNTGSGADGAINITGASVMLPPGAVADLGGTHHATGGTIALTATDTANGSVSAGPLTGTSVHVSAPKQIALGAVTADAGPIVFNGGNLTLTGPLSTVSGTILATSIGPIQLNAQVTATGGDVLFTSLGGTGITATNSAIRARNSATDVSTNGTVSNTGAVTLTGSTESAGTGRTVALHGP